MPYDPSKPSTDIDPVESEATVETPTTVQPPPALGYGNRADGTKKGPGFLGELKRPDGKISTELSIGVDLDGKETEIPSLVPTLTQIEIDHLLAGGDPTNEIVHKAADHAKKRLSQGLSPFKAEREFDPNKPSVDLAPTKGVNPSMPSRAFDPSRPSTDIAPEETEEEFKAKERAKTYSEMAGAAVEALPEMGVGLAKGLGKALVSPVTQSFHGTRWAYRKAIGDEKGAKEDMDAAVKTAVSVGLGLADIYLFLPKVAWDAGQTTSKQLLAPVGEVLGEHLLNKVTGVPIVTPRTFSQAILEADEERLHKKWLQKKDAEKGINPAGTTVGDLAVQFDLATPEQVSRLEHTYVDPDVMLASMMVGPVAGGAVKRALAGATKPVAATTERIAAEASKAASEKAANEVAGAGAKAVTEKIITGAEQAGKKIKEVKEAIAGEAGAAKEAVTGALGSVPGVPTILRGGRILEKARPIYETLVGVGRALTEGSRAGRGALETAAMSGEATTEGARKALMFAGKVGGNIPINVIRNTVQNIPSTLQAAAHGAVVMGLAEGAKSGDVEGLIHGGISGAALGAGTRVGLVPFEGHQRVYAEGVRTVEDWLQNKTPEQRDAIIRSTKYTFIQKDGVEHPPNTIEDLVRLADMESIASGIQRSTGKNMIFRYGDVESHVAEWKKENPAATPQELAEFKKDISQRGFAQQDFGNNKAVAYININHGRSGQTAFHEALHVMFRSAPEGTAAAEQYKMAKQRLKKAINDEYTTEEMSNHLRGYQKKLINSAYNNVSHGKLTPEQYYKVRDAIIAIDDNARKLAAEATPDVAEEILKKAQRDKFKLARKTHGDMTAEEALAWSRGIVSSEAFYRTHVKRLNDMLDAKGNITEAGRDYIAEELLAEHNRSFLTRVKGFIGPTSTRISRTEEGADISKYFNKQHVVQIADEGVLGGISRLLGTAGVKLDSTGAPVDANGKPVSSMDDLPFKVFSGMKASPVIDRLLADMWAKRANSIERFGLGVEAKDKIVEIMEPSMVFGVDAKKFIPLAMRMGAIRVTEDAEGNKVPVLDKQGKPIFIKPKDREKETLRRDRLIQNAIVRGGVPDEPGALIPDQESLRKNGRLTGSFLGEKSMTAILADPQIPASIKKRIIEWNTILKDRWTAENRGMMRDRIVEYNKVYSRGKAGSYATEQRFISPIGIQITGAGNVNLLLFDVGHFAAKLNKTLEGKPTLLAHWMGDRQALLEDIYKVMDNHFNGRPGASGLSAASTDPMNIDRIGVEKASIINALLDFGTKENRAANPWYDFVNRRGVADESSEPGSIRSFRLERVLSSTPSNSTPIFIDYRKGVQNFMAGEGERTPEERALNERLIKSGVVKPLEGVQPVQQAKATPPLLALEAIPGAKTGILSGIQTEPFKAKVPFTQRAVSSILAGKTADPLSVALGLNPEYSMDRAMLAGAFAGEVNPMIPIRFRDAETNSDGTLTDNYKLKMDILSAGLGKALVQQMVGYTHQVPAFSMGEANAMSVVVDGGRQLSPRESTGVDNLLAKSLGKDGYALINEPAGVRVLNFTDKTPEQFELAVQAALRYGSNARSISDTVHWRNDANAPAEAGIKGEKYDQIIEEKIREAFPLDKGNPRASRPPDIQGAVDLLQQRARPVITAERIARGLPGKEFGGIRYMASDRDDPHFLVRPQQIRSTSGAIPRGGGKNRLAQPPQAVAAETIRNKIDYSDVEKEYERVLGIAAADQDRRGDLDLFLRQYASVHDIPYTVTGNRLNNFGDVNSAVNSDLASRLQNQKPGALGAMKFGGEAWVMFDAKNKVAYKIAPEIKGLGYGLHGDMSIVGQDGVGLIKYSGGTRDQYLENIGDHEILGPSSDAYYLGETGKVILTATPLLETKVSATDANDFLIQNGARKVKSEATADSPTSAGTNEWIKKDADGQWWLATDTNAGNFLRDESGNVVANDLSMVRVSDSDAQKMLAAAPVASAPLAAVPPVAPKVAAPLAAVHPQTASPVPAPAPVVPPPKRSFMPAERDAAYLKAVESGDTAAAQRMVDEAAKSAGYNLVGMRHGTTNEKLGTSEDPYFRKEKIRSHETDAPFNGFWFTNSESASPAWTNAKKTLSVSLRLNNAAPWDVIRKVAAEVHNNSIHREGARGYADEVRMRLEEMGYDGAYHYYPPEIKESVLNKTGRFDYQTVRGSKRSIVKHPEGHIDYYEGNELVTGYEDLADFKDQHKEKVAVVFDPSQIKSADPITRDDAGNVIPLSQRFNPKSKDIRFMPAEPVFKSNILSGLDTMPEKMATQELLARLLKIPGAKKEFDWIGGDDLLAGKKSVTRQEVKDFVEANQVHVHEKILGQASPELQARIADLRSAAETADSEMVGAQDALVDAFRERNRGSHSTMSAQQSIKAMRFPEIRKMFPVEGGKYIEAADKSNKAHEAVRIASVDLPDKNLFERSDLLTPGAKPGTNREMVLSLPEKPISPNIINHEDMVREAQRWAERNGDNWDALGPNGRQQYIDRVADANASQRDIMGKTFRSTHYPNIPNPIAHVRWNERTGPNGERIMFIEEFQSDWDLAARKLRQKGEGDYGSGVADNPFRGDWSRPTAKRVLRWAADNGYDKVAWTTGDMQIERYDLRKQVKSITANKNADGTFELFYVKQGDDGTRPLAENAKAEALDGIVGKELAQKIAAQTEDGKTYEGLDLKVGGEGKRKLYDEIIPQEFGKIGKKFGGKVGTTDIVTRDPKDQMVQGAHPFEIENNMDTGWLTVRRKSTGEELFKTKDSDAAYNFVATQLGKEIPTSVHSMDITPSMKEGIAGKAQMMFMPAEKVVHEQTISMRPFLDDEQAPAIRFMPVSAGKAKLLGIEDDKPSLYLLERYPNIAQGIGNAQQLKDKLNLELNGLKNELQATPGKYHSQQVDVARMKAQAQDMVQNGAQGGDARRSAQKILEADENQLKIYADMYLKQIQGQQSQVFEQWVDYVSNGGYSEAQQYLLLHSMATEMASRNPDGTVRITKLGGNSERTSVSPSPDVAGRVMGMIQAGGEPKRVSQMWLEASDEIEKASRASRERVPAKTDTGIDGEWIKFPSKANDPVNFSKNVSDLEALAKTSADFGERSWCTGLGQANYQLSNGDFWIYTVDNKARVAIRMDGSDQIGEMSGILKGQYLEPQMAPVALTLVKEKGFIGGEDFITDAVLRQGLRSIETDLAEGKIDKAAAVDAAKKVIEDAKYDLHDKSSRPYVQNDRGMIVVTDNGFEISQGEKVLRARGRYHNDDILGLYPKLRESINSPSEKKYSHLHPELNPSEPISYVIQSPTDLSNAGMTSRIMSESKMATLDVQADANLFALTKLHTLEIDARTPDGHQPTVKAPALESVSVVRLNPDAKLDAPKLNNFSYIKSGDVWIFGSKRITQDQRANLIENGKTVHTGDMPWKDVKPSNFPAKSLFNHSSENPERPALYKRVFITEWNGEKVAMSTDGVRAIVIPFDANLQLDRSYNIADEQRIADIQNAFRPEDIPQDLRNVSVGDMIPSEGSGYASSQFPKGGLIELIASNRAASENKIDVTPQFLNTLRAQSNINQKLLGTKDWVRGSRVERIPTKIEITVREDENTSIEYSVLINPVYMEGLIKTFHENGIHDLEILMPPGYAAIIIQSKSVKGAVAALMPIRDSGQGSFSIPDAPRPANADAILANIKIAPPKRGQAISYMPSEGSGEPLPRLENGSVTKFTPDLAIRFMPSNAKVDLRDYADRQIIALAADRLGVGPMATGPEGKKKIMSADAQGGRGFMNIFNGGGWAFTNEQTANRFLTRAKEVADKDGKALVAVTVLSPINHLNSPYGQLGMSNAIRAAIENGDISEKSADRQIRAILAKVKRSPKVEGNRSMAAVREIKTFADYEKAVNDKSLNFQVAAEIVDRAQNVKLPISEETRAGAGIDIATIAKDLSDPELSDVPAGSVVALMEIDTRKAPTRDDFHYSYPVSIHGKRIGFLKDFPNIQDLTSSEKIYSGKATGNRILAPQPLQAVMPELDLLGKSKGKWIPSNLRSRRSLENLKAPENKPTRAQTLAGVSR